MNALIALFAIAAYITFFVLLANGVIGFTGNMVFIALSIAALAYFNSKEQGIRKRIAAGRCWKCGYDLRASGDTCPECGEERVSLDED